MFSTLAVYSFIIVKLSLIGKSELAQLSITNLIFVFLLSNSLQNAMAGRDNTLEGGLLAASVLFTLNIVFKKLKILFSSFKKALESDAGILVHNRGIIAGNGTKNLTSIDKFFQTICEHGSRKLSNIDRVLLKTDDNISGASNQYKHSSRRMINRKSNE